MKPLTVQELRNLEVGDWVWVIILRFDGVNRPHTGDYYRIHPFSRDKDKELSCGWRGRTTAFNYSDYGTKWLAYKNKETAEAKGEIVELPCNIGDTVWGIGYSSYGVPTIDKYTCSGFSITGLRVRINIEKTWHGENVPYVFLTKSEAERRLAELKGE